MNTKKLDGEWQLVGTSPEGNITEFCAHVPGNTLKAVLEANPDFDVFYRDNAEQVQIYEKYDWVYTKTFEFEKNKCKYNIVFERLDTYCDVYLNDKHIAYCDNGFIEHRFDVTQALQNGENVLKVYIYSPVKTAEGRKSRAFCAFSGDRLYTRRMQCTYGWDWTMRFVTCGIGSTYIQELDDEVRVENAYVYTKYIDEECAEIIADITFSNFENGDNISAVLYDADGNIASSCTRYNEEQQMHISLDVESPKLWYPNGYGEAYLYTFVIKSGGRELYSTPFGIRTVKIMQLEDKEGSENYNTCLELKKTDNAKKSDFNERFSGFVVKINGERVMCKGANWVPCEPFAISDTKEKTTKLLTLAKESGINMLRVWGGGAFESEHFYNECSRLGIMVTQDFLMACGDYPEEQEWFLEGLKSEAKYATKLIKNKPCLVWWTGDNENATEGTNMKRWYHGRNSAYKAIMPVLLKEDYMRDFLPSSPFGGEMYKSSTVGTTHNTEFLKYLFKYVEETDMSDFKEKLKDFKARFISEEPVMGAVSLSTIKRFMTEDDIYGTDTSMWLYHTKKNPAVKTELFEYELMMSEKLFGEFKDGKDRFFKLKYLQYEWMRISLEQVRREKGFCSGVIYWMFNDCWPASSGWAFVDYYCIPKASYYAFKRGAKAVVGSIDYENGTYKFCVSNDTNARTIKVHCYTLSGKTVMPETELSIEKNSLTVVYETMENIENGDMLIMDIVDEGGECDRAFYKPDKLILIPCSVTITAKNDSAVTVKADSYIHVVELEGEAVFEDNYFSLIPGEERMIKYIGDSDIEVCGYTVK